MESVSTNFYRTRWSLAFPLFSQDIEEGLILMMGGILTPEQAHIFKTVMQFDEYIEEDSIPDEIKLTLIGGGRRNVDEAGDAGEVPTYRVSLSYLRLVLSSA